ncbi:MAG TPA: hypothetical protein EYP39_02045 [Ghiorsea sp.]|nr:hypothetical protein [Ghiorsea sp.]
MRFLLPTVSLSLSLSVLIIFNSVSAKTNAPKVSETQVLKTLFLEMEAINPLIEEAKRRADHQDRFVFDYPCLMVDLRLVKQALRLAIYQPKAQSNPYQKLCANYGNAGRMGGETASLQLLMQELQALTAMIYQGIALADTAQQIQFNYPVFESDINTISMAIETAIAGSGEHPRSFPALRGSFTK